MSDIKFCILKYYIFINTLDKNRAIQNKLQQNFATISVLPKNLEQNPESCNFSLYINVFLQK